MNRVDEIRNVNYIPNNDDILQSRRRTSDIQKIEFQVKIPLKSTSQNLHQTFCMFDVGGQRGERRKWIQVFDGVSAVMFLIDSSSFDAIDEETGRNKLRETINLFYEVWTTRFLLNSNFVLLFNKQDILREKIERGYKIEDHFPEYKLYKFPSQDQELVSKAGEKLNLFRQSSRSTSSTLSSSCQQQQQQQQSSINSQANNKPPSQFFSSPPMTPNTRYHPASLANQGRSKSVSAGMGLTRRRSQSIHMSNNNNNLSPQNQYQNQQQTVTNIRVNIKENTTTSPQTSRTPNLPRQQTISATTLNPQQQQQASQQQQQHQQEFQLTPEQSYIRARSFIRDKFLQITRQVDSDRRKFSTPTLGSYNTGRAPSCVDQPKRNVCYHYTTATDTDNIRDLFENLQKKVIKSRVLNMRQQ